VHWQVPIGAPPPRGWPVVFMFQGSFFSGNTFWDGAPTMPFGGWTQVHVTRALLDQGFAVVTPKTRFDGAYYWDTNVVGLADNWVAADDHHLMLQVFAQLGSLIAPVDVGRLYATGISSGGYMTSRMAFSYPKKFRALAVVAGSWATCGGPLCSVPNPLPADHPPTLFLHGEADETVPIGTMRLYADQLASQGIETRVVTDADAGHAWIGVSPSEVPAWFVGHP
jgi:poly(3-hydroxybutyrate) depolymerase